MIACVPPIGIAAGSKLRTSGRLWARPCNPGGSSPKHPVDVDAARMKSVRSSGDSKKSYANACSDMNWCTGSMPEPGIVMQLFESVGLPPRQRGAEPMARERWLPIPVVLVEQHEVGLGVARREPLDLLVGEVDVLVRPLLSPGHRIDDARTPSNR